MSDFEAEAIQALEQIARHLRNIEKSLIEGIDTGSGDIVFSMDGENIKVSRADVRAWLLGAKSQSGDPKSC